MSTKIYNGFALPYISTIADLQALTMSMREECKEIRNKIFAQYMGGKIVQILDAFHMYHDYDHARYLQVMNDLFHNEVGGKRGSIMRDEFLVKHTPWTAAYQHYHEQIKKSEKSPYSTDGLDIKFDICFLPVGNKILGIPYTNCREYEKYLGDQPEYQYYGYWNNSDQDEECTDEEWEQRKTDWDIAIGVSGIPSRNGFVAEIVEQKSPMEFLHERKDTYPLVLAVMDGCRPSADRAHEYALDRIATRLYAEMHDDADPDAWVASRWNSMWDAQREVKGGYETTYKAEYDRHLEEIISRLPTTYSLEDMITKWEHPDTDD